MRLGVDDVAHRLAIDGEALVGLSIVLIPAFQAAVEVERIDADETKYG